MSCCYSTVLSWMQQSKSNNRGTLLSFFLAQGISCAHHSQITSSYSRDASVHVMSHLDGLAWLPWQNAEPFLLEPCWFANLTLCLLWFDTANVETCLTTETASRHVFALSNESRRILLILSWKKRVVRIDHDVFFPVEGHWARVSCCYLHELHRRCQCVNQSVSSVHATIDAS